MITTWGIVAYFDSLFNLASHTTFLFIAYGTGTTEPTESDETLVTETDRVAVTTEIISVYYPFDTLRVTGAFAIGTTPPVVTEIGVFSALTAGTIWARKLVGTTETGASSFTPPANSTMYVHFDFSMRGSTD